MYFVPAYRNWWNYPIYLKVAALRMYFRCKQIDTIEITIPWTEVCRVVLGVDQPRESTHSLEADRSTRLNLHPLCGLHICLSILPCHSMRNIVLDTSPSPYFIPIKLKYKKVPRSGANLGSFWFSFIFSHKQRLRPLGYCAPQSAKSYSCQIFQVNKLSISYWHLPDYTTRKCVCDGFKMFTWLYRAKKNALSAAVH